VAKTPEGRSSRHSPAKAEAPALAAPEPREGGSPHYLGLAELGPPVKDPPIGIGPKSKGSRFRNMMNCRIQLVLLAALTGMMLQPPAVLAAVEKHGTPVTRKGGRGV